jgi:hypothetical protein
MYDVAPFKEFKVKGFMPKVKGKKFPYTAKGKKAAKAYAKKKK